MAGLTIDPTVASVASSVTTASQHNRGEQTSIRHGEALREISSYEIDNQAGYDTSSSVGEDSSAGRQAGSTKEGVRPCSPSADSGEEQVPAVLPPGKQVNNSGIEVRIGGIPAVATTAMAKITNKTKHIFSMTNHSASSVAKSTSNNANSDLACLRNAIKMVNLEAIKAEELYKAESSLLQKANQQLMKFSKLLQEQDAELATTEEQLHQERKQREAAEKHYIKLKKMMVVKDVEVSEAELKKKSEHGLRKGAEREMTMLRRQLQAKDTQLSTIERKYQKECQRREKFEVQMMKLAKQAGTKTAEEQYQILQKIRHADEDDQDGGGSKENSFAAANHGVTDTLKSTRKGHSYMSQHHNSNDAHINSLMQQIEEMKEQVRIVEEELHKSNKRLSNERQLREAADRQVIVMREKGYALNVDRRTSARTHVEDCLNTERLKMKHIDLIEQYEQLKREANESLEKARTRIDEEKLAREAVEVQMEANRNSFKEAVKKAEADHQAQVAHLNEQLNAAKQEIEKAKHTTSDTSEELIEMRDKYANFTQQLIDAKAESKKEQLLRSELQEEMKMMEYELDNMEEELNKAQAELKQKEQELSDLRLESTNDNKDLQIKQVEFREKITILEDENRALEARSKLFKGKFLSEQELRERIEEQIYDLERTNEHIKAELATANHQQQVSEDRCETLRQRVQAITANFQKTLAQADNSEETNKLKQQVLTLTSNLTITKDKCAVLRESLEKAERKYQQLDEDAKGTVDAKEKIRKEQRMREKAEDECRSLREQIILLKHEQVMSAQKLSGRDTDTAVAAQISSLEEKLAIAETRQKMSQEQHETEKRRREELEKQNKAFHGMIPDYAKAEERLQIEEKIRKREENAVINLRPRLTNDAALTETSHVTAAKIAELSQVKHQYDQSQKNTPNKSSDEEKKKREHAEKQVMSMRLKMEAKESEILNLKSQLSDQRQSGSSSGSTTSRNNRHSLGRRNLTESGSETRSPPPPSRQSVPRSSPGTNRANRLPQRRQLPPLPQQDQAFIEQILTSLPPYVRNNFGRIGFVKHSTYEYWPALVLDPFTVPLAIQQKWMELYYEVRLNSYCVIFVWFSMFVTNQRICLTL